MILICVERMPMENAVWPRLRPIEHKYRGLQCLHTFVVWNPECSRWGIIWIVLALLASLKPFAHFAHLCLQQEGIIVLLCYSCLWIRRTKRQQNKQNVMFIQILIRQNHLAGIACIQHHQQGCQLVRGALPGPVSWIFKAWNSLFEGLHES